MRPSAFPPSEAQVRWQALPAVARWQRLAASAALGSAMALAPVWLAHGPAVGCPFLALTGLPCPLCGGTRACAALAQGDWAGAWAFNAGAVVLLVWLLLCAVQAGVEALVGGRSVALWDWQRRAGRAALLGLSLHWTWQIARVL